MNHNQMNTHANTHAGNDPITPGPEKERRMIFMAILVTVLFVGIALYQQDRMARQQDKIYNLEKRFEQESLVIGAGAVHPFNHCLKIVIESAKETDEKIKIKNAKEICAELALIMHSADHAQRPSSHHHDSRDRY